MDISAAESCGAVSSARQHLVGRLFILGWGDVLFSLSAAPGAAVDFVFY